MFCQVGRFSPLVHSVHAKSLPPVSRPQWALNVPDKKFSRTQLAPPPQRRGVKPPPFTSPWTDYPVSLGRSGPASVVEDRPAAP